MRRTLLLACAAGLLIGVPLASAWGDRSLFRGSTSTAAAPLGVRAEPIGGPCDISAHCWGADARDFDGQSGAHVVYICPSYGSAYAGIFGVWGTDVYSDNSSVCTAAVHAGKITPTSGGIITIEIRPGETFYQGSTRNGITSRDAGSRTNSFVVVDATPGTPPSGGVGLYGWNALASDFRDFIGARFVYTCPAIGTAGPVSGTTVYSDNSSVCTAAVHAGVLKLANGGKVTIEIRAGQASYTGSTRNGITSSNHGSWPGSYVIVGGTGPAGPPSGSATGTVLVNGSPFTTGSIAYGSIVDVTHGRLTLRTDLGTLLVYGDGSDPASFRLTRASEPLKGTKRPLVQLTLVGGDFSACGARTVSGRAPTVSRGKPKPKLVRALWGSGKGRFRTQGRYASATVRGTIWLTADRCDGTLVQVTQGTVAVRDFTHRRTIPVHAGHSYLAPAHR